MELRLKKTIHSTLAACFVAFSSAAIAGEDLPFLKQPELLDETSPNKLFEAGKVYVETFTEEELKLGLVAPELDSMVLLDPTTKKVFSDASKEIETIKAQKFTTKPNTKAALLGSVDLCLGSRGVYREYLSYKARSVDKEESQRVTTLAVRITRAATHELYLLAAHPESNMKGKPNHHLENFCSAFKRYVKIRTGYDEPERAIASHKALGNEDVSLALEK